MRLIRAEERIVDLFMSIVMAITITDSRPSLELFPNLSDEDVRALKLLYDIMEERVFRPILESENREAVLEERLEQFGFFMQGIVPIVHRTLDKVLELRERPDWVSKVAGLLKSEIRKELRDSRVRRLLYTAVDVLEEHDRYTAALSIDTLASLINDIGSVEYVRVYLGTALALITGIYAILKKPNAVESMSVIAAKYAEMLEPYVANIQVSLEPSLERLRKPTPEEDYEKSRELRGPLLGM